MSDIVLQRTDLFEARHPHRVRADGILAKLGAALKRAAESWAAYIQFRRELDVAMRLDDRLLEDIGLTRHDLTASRRAGRWLRAADET